VSKRPDNRDKERRTGVLTQNIPVPRSARTASAPAESPEVQEADAAHEAPNVQPAKIRVEGAEDAERVLTLDLGRLIDEVREMPDPDPEGDAYYRAGVQLLSALQHECNDFGLSSPGVRPGASVAEQIMGITDEAFEAADEFLMLTEALEEGDQVPPQQRIGASQMCALLLELNTLSIREEKRAIRHLPAATDRRVGEIGGEFF
jgi:hypothetical protein